MSTSKTCPIRSLIVVMAIGYGAVLLSIAGMILIEQLRYAYTVAFVFGLFSLTIALVMGLPIQDSRRG